MIEIKKLIPFMLFLFFQQQIIAQKIIKEATLIYTITASTSKNTNTNLIKSFDGATSSFFIKGGQIRTDFSTKLGNETAIYDDKKSTGIILKDYSDQKLMITLTHDDWKELYNKYVNTEFSITDETKNINGFSCKKAVSKKQETDLVIFYSPDYYIQNKEYNLSFPSLNGLPVEISLLLDGINYKYTLSKFSEESISNIKFELNKTSEYRVISYQELKGNKKGN